MKTPNARGGTDPRPVHDAPPVDVALAWRGDRRPAELDALVALVREHYGRR